MARLSLIISLCIALCFAALALPVPFAFFKQDVPGAPPAPPSPDVEWKMSEGSGTSLADATGNGHTATITGGTATWGTTQCGGLHCVHLQGTPQYIDGGAVANYTTTSFSVAFWMNADSFTGGPIICGNGIFAGNGYYVQISNIGAIAIVANGTSAVFAQTGNFVVSTATPYFIVCTVEAAAFHIYVNGVEQSYATANTPLAPNSSSSDMLLGQFASGNYYTGYLEDVAFYPTTLTQTQITTLNTAGPKP